MTNMSAISKQHFQLAPKMSFFRISVDEYHDLIEQNILTTADRVELLDGFLVQKLPQNDPHSSTVDRLDEECKKLVPNGWRARSQLPVTLSRSEPEPDVAIVRGDRRSYDFGHPKASDFGVIIEVADTSLTLDRREKGRIYAEAGIPEYWVVNLTDRQIEVYTSPDSSAVPPAYRQHIYAESQSVPLCLDGQTVGHLAVGPLLPSA